MTYIKPDPDMQEQEDLIMSYLNTEYISSSPSSTTSSEITGSPEKQMMDDDFMLDTTTTPDIFNTIPITTTTSSFADSTVDVINSAPFWSNHDLLLNPCLQNNVLDTFPFFIDMNTMTQQQQQQQHHHHQLNSDSEQPKKKRGRKKRDSLPVASLCNQPTLLAPKPLAPRPPESIPPIIKQEPIIVPLISHTTPSPNHPHQEDAQKVAQIQKRQERLIKNRAAALLSRKRKREHLTQLEEEKQKLLVENERLQSQLTLLETKLENLEKENLELKEKLKEKETTTTIIQMSHQQQQQQHLQQHLQHKKQHDILQKPTTKATGVVFMIILFSFALFTLPTRSSVNRLTVGGSGLLEKNQFPLIDSSSMLPPIMKEEGREEIPTDLVLLDSVRPRDLQTWINNHKLVDQQKSLMTSDNSNNHVYLYSKEFSQLASLTMNNNGLKQLSSSSLPTISLLSPYNQTTAYVDKEQCYLQIDVQVLRSNVIKGQLMSLQEFGSASTRDEMKKDLITTKKRGRDKRASSNRISRIIV